MKGLLILLFCFYQSYALSIFCFEERFPASGRYVYFEHFDPDNAAGCCAGGAGSVLIYDRPNSEFYWYECITSTTLPLVCYQDNSCINIGFTTSGIGGTAFDECCTSGKGITSFTLSGQTICVQCTAPIQPPAVAQGTPPFSRIQVTGGAAINAMSMGTLLIGLVLVGFLTGTF